MERAWMKHKKKRLAAMLLAICMEVGMLLGVTPGTVRAAELPSVYYSGHMQTYGNLAQVKDGTTLGNLGTGKRLEAIKIDSSVKLTYRAHVQSYGWQDWKTNGQLAGTMGKGKRLEAICIRLTGQDAMMYDIYYRSHISGGDWLGWSKNGAISGTCGYGVKLDGIQIQLVAKDAAAPGSTDYGSIEQEKAVSVVYSGHVQTYGNLPETSNGAILGTIGQAKRMEAISISLKNTDVDGGISYRVHGQTYGWQSLRSDGQMAGTTGQAKRLEAIEINLTGNIARYYDIYYRVHIQSYGWLDWAKNGATAGSVGMAKRMEAIQIKLVAKGGTAPGTTMYPFVKSAFDSVGSNRVVQGIGNVDLWLGDSRMVGFGNTIYGYMDRNESIHPNFLAKVSGGCVWLNSTGYQHICETLNQKPNAVIVSNFGLNDIYNYENYAAFYKKLHAEYPLATICVMSVNPVGANFRYSNNYGAAGFNQNIREFNEYMRNHVADFNGYFIDTYYGLNPQTIADGVHYSAPTCRSIYKYVTGN